MPTTYHANGDGGWTRRSFLAASATAAAAYGLFFDVKNAHALSTGENDPDPVTPGTGESIVYRFSVCQNCHSRCGIVGKVVGPTGSTDPAAGVLVKIDGNPYHPNNMEEDERLAYATSKAIAETTPGRLCPKGQAGVQVLYDPYRIKHPLKRVGARGSGQWQVISWNTAFTEIAGRIDGLIPTANRLTTAIDSSIPNLGPIANQLMFSPGRTTDGEIIERIFKNTYGTANYRLDHTSICETSHHIANEQIMSGKNHVKPDLINTEYLILFGSNYNEANFPMLALARKLAEFKKVTGRKLVVVDPRFSNTAAKADVWIPARPGTDGAVALGMAWRLMQRIINNDVDAQGAIQFLTNPGQTAATNEVPQEYCWSDATWLVCVGKSSAAAGSATIGRYVQCNQLSAGYGAAFGAGGTANKVAIVGGVPADATGNVTGTLLPGTLTLTDVNGNNIYCMSVFELLKEEIYDGKSIDYYANLAGVDATLLWTIADEFLLKGKTAVANAYRGTVQHTNGFQAMKSVMLLNWLVGNYDWKGGNTIGGGAWGYDSGVGGAMKGTSYAPTGPRIDRASNQQAAFNAWYTGTYGAGAFPAERPWGPFWKNGNYQEIIPSIAAGYPYACKVLITYWNAFPYSVPALRQVFESTIRDESKVPLFVSISTTMGEVESFADYILPETTFLERWSFPGGTPTITTKFTSFRQPLVGSFDGAAWDAAFNSAGTNTYYPINPDTKHFEDILSGIMSALGLTTFITGGLPSLPTNGWVMAKMGVENLAANAVQTVADIIDKGGVFADPGTSYSGNYMASRYAGDLKMYSEPLARTIDTMKDAAAAAVSFDTGFVDGAFTNHLADVKAYRFDPLPAWQPVEDIAGNPVTDLSYPFQLITFKSILHGQARTVDLPWLTGIMPENFLWISSADANALGIRTYDRIRVTSASNSVGIEGRAYVTEGIRPGVVGISHHYGHWEHAGNVRYEDGTPIGGDVSRKAGMQPNEIMRLDPYLGDVSLQEKIGGSCAFYDTRVRVQKIS